MVGVNMKTIFFFFIIFAFSVQANICSRNGEVQEAIFREIVVQICDPDSGSEKKRNSPECQEARRMALQMRCERVSRWHLEQVRWLGLFNGTTQTLRSEDLEGLPNLETLVIDNADFTSISFPEMGLPSLRMLEITENKSLEDKDGNKFLADLDLVKRFPKLVQLSLRENGFTGHLPSELGNLPQLVTLEIAEPQMTGPIPESFRKLTKLRSLSRLGPYLEEDFYNFLLEGDKDKECRLFTKGNRESVKDAANQLLSGTVTFKPIMDEFSLVLDEEFTHFSIEQNVYASYASKHNNIQTGGKFIGSASLLLVPVIGPVLASVAALFAADSHMDNRERILHRKSYSSTRWPIPYEDHGQPPRFIYEAPLFSGLDPGESWTTAKVHYRLFRRGEGQKEDRAIHINCEVRYRAAYDVGQTRMAKQYQTRKGHMELRECFGEISPPTSEAVTDHQYKEDERGKILHEIDFQINPYGLGEESDDICAMLENQQEGREDINNESRTDSPIEHIPSSTQDSNRRTFGR